MDLSKSAPATAISPFSALITMFYEPGKTYAALEPRKAAWVPLIVVMLTSLITTVWYFSVVDFAWLQDQMFADVPATEAEAVKGFVTKGFMMTTGIIGSLVAAPAVFAIIALYLILISKTTKSPMQFESAFALACWSSVPIMLTFPLAAIQLLMANNGQVGLEELNPLSLNQLFFQYKMTDKMAGIANNVSIFTFWNIFLMVIGYEIWAKAKRSTAISVIVVPYAVIYGLWFAISFVMSKAA
jgi:hypothetical protein